MHPDPDDLALIALGETTDLDEARHVGDCVECRTELDGLRHVVEVGRSLTPDDRLVQPSGSVWQRIQAEVDDTPAPGDELAARRRRRGWTPVAAAASAALVVGFGVGWAVSRQGPPEEGVVGATTLNALPQWPGANGTARVEEDEQGNRTLVVSVEVPPDRHVDGSMQVWLSDTRAMHMVPMGVMPGPSGRFQLPPTMDLDTHPIVDVSLEPPDDADPAHSDVSVVRGRLAI